MGGAAAHFGAERMSRLPPHAPAGAQALAAMLLKASVHPYAAVRDAAAAALAGACKRLPCLAQPCLPTYLAALAGVPLPGDAAVAAAMGFPGPASGPTPAAGDKASGNGGEPGADRNGGAGGDGVAGGEGRAGAGAGPGASAVVPAELLAALRAAAARPAVRAAAGETTAAGAGPRGPASDPEMGAPLGRHSVRRRDGLAKHELLHAGWYAGEVGCRPCAWFTACPHKSNPTLPYDLNVTRAPAAENAVEEGLVGGAAAALCGQPFYRLLARQPAALAAAVAALLASGAHASPRSSAAVAQYALQLVVSFIRPPALAQAQVRAAAAGRRRPPDGRHQTLPAPHAPCIDGVATVPGLPAGTCLGPTWAP